EAEKEQVAPPESGCQRDGEALGDLGVGEIADVVVLGHDEALPLPRGPAVEASVQLQDYRPPLERQLRGVRVRHMHDGRAAVGPKVAETAAPPARSAVRGG